MGEWDSLQEEIGLIIDDLGESTTVRVVTKTAYSKYGDSTESLADSTSIKCFMNILGQEDKEVKERNFKAGDIRFWYKGDQTINRGDRVQYASNWYEVTNVIPIVLGGTTLVKDIRVKKT